MLALMLVVLAAEPEPGSPADLKFDQRYGQRAGVQLHLELDSGFTLADRAPIPGAPLVANALVGLRVRRPRAVEGGGRPLLLLGVESTRSFYDSGQSCVGMTAFGFELWRLSMLFGSGFGLLFGPGLKPRAALVVSVRASLLLGPVSVGAGYEHAVLFGSLDHLDLTGRTADGGSIFLFLSKSFDLAD